MNWILVAIIAVHSPGSPPGFQPMSYVDDFKDRTACEQMKKLKSFNFPRYKFTCIQATSIE
jgi:hypothetical protein